MAVAFNNQTFWAKTSLNSFSTCYFVDLESKSHFLHANKLYLKMADQTGLCLTTGMAKPFYILDTVIPVEISIEVKPKE